jgi:hypothetical protein
MAARRSRPRNKYGAIKTVVDGITFDSMGESERYKDLKHLEKAELIKDLKLQVPFELVPAVKINGRTKPAMKYIADFVYFDVRKNSEVVEDFKGGVLTPEYRIKRHLMKWRHNIDILETHARGGTRR